MPPYSYYYDTYPPWVEKAAPYDGETDVSTVKSLSFSLVDDTMVDLAQVVIWVREDKVFDGAAEEFSDGWEDQSTFSRNADNGYDFVLVPSIAYRWDVGEEVKVQVLAGDFAGRDSDTIWYFTASETRLTVFDAYRFLPFRMRKMDERSPGKLRYFSDLINRTWEHTLLRPAMDLNTVFKPREMRSDLLIHQAPLVGFTSDRRYVLDAATETEQRRILAGAINYWNAKGIELGWERGVKMVTGNQFRIRNYFDFRALVGEVSLTEELENFDPNVISFAGDNPYPSGLDLQFISPNIFYLVDALDFFDSPSQYHFVSITNDPTYQNVGTYRVQQLLPLSNFGTIYGAWNDYHALHTGMSWRMNPHADEFVTEIRIVDEPYGIGKVNRELLQHLIELVSVSSERIDAVFVDFMDNFDEEKYINNFDQWQVLNGNPLVEDGILVLHGAGDLVIDNKEKFHRVGTPFEWGEQSTVFKVAPGVGYPPGPGTKGFFFFHRSSLNADDAYVIQMDYDANVLSLHEIVGGVLGPAVSSGVVPNVVPPYDREDGRTVGAGEGVRLFDVLRVDTMWTLGGNDLRIVVRFSNLEIINYVWVGASFRQGGIGISAEGNGIVVDYTEVNVIPTEVVRVGLNP